MRGKSITSGSSNCAFGNFTVRSLPILPLPEGDQGTSPHQLNVAQAVRERYSAASQQPAADLCCAVPYNAAYLKALPAEILERDYGCGDPSKHVRPGEVVLDLGSGAGKICYIAAQVVGPRGHVMGVDANDDMLRLARKHQDEVGRRLGYHNVTFRKGHIQDLALDLEAFAAYLHEHPATDSASWTAAEEYGEKLRLTQPMIASGSIDVVVSNCVLNLVARGDREQLFAEIFRVLKAGGRAVISDVVCDRPVPKQLQNDAQLWSGCISGAFLEAQFPAAFAAAGFHGMTILERQSQPWQVIEAIEFRSVTIEAHKPHGSLECGTESDVMQAVIYRGPWRSVSDDFGNTFSRGQRSAVSDAAYAQLTKNPYAAEVIGVPARSEASPAANQPKNEAGGDCCAGKSC